jgi:hypothetical protein
MRTTHPLSPSTNSMTWPESIPLPTDTSLVVAEVAESTGEYDPTATAVDLFHRLEASLRSSQTALLLRDLAGIEEHTRELLGLRTELEALCAVGSLGNPGLGNRDLSAAALHVLHLGRVQMALLERAQRSLRMIANLLAGPRAGYSPTSGCERALNPDTHPPSRYPIESEEQNPCPA